MNLGATFSRIWNRLKEHPVGAAAATAGSIAWVALEIADKLVSHKLADSSLLVLTIIAAACLLLLAIVFACGFELKRTAKLTRRRAVVLSGLVIVVLSGGGWAAKQSHRVVPRIIGMSRNPEAISFFERGRGYDLRPDVSRQTLNDAALLYDRAIGFDERFARAHAYLSRVHSRMFMLGYDREPSRLERAKASADRAMQIEPDLPEGFAALGYYEYWGFRNYDAAIGHFNRAARSRPNDPDIAAALGFIHRRRNSWETAVRYLEKAVGYAPPDADKLTELGYTYEAMWHYPHAIQAYTRAQQYAPDAYAASIAKGRAFFIWTGSLDSLKVALEQIPPERDPDGEVTIARFELEMLQRRFRAAHQVISSARHDWYRRQAVAYPRVLLQALALEAGGEGKRARALFDSARVLLKAEVAKHPQEGRYHSALGLAYAHLDSARLAAASAEQAVRLRPLRRDVIEGAVYLTDQAAILARLEQGEPALRILRLLLCIPSGITVAELSTDPRWDALRSDTSFQTLLESAAERPYGGPPKICPHRSRLSPT